MATRAAAGGAPRGALPESAHGAPVNAPWQPPAELPPAWPACAPHPVPRRAFALSAVVVAAITLATRLPLASQFLFAWDSANFALGLDDYNVAAHQPHPPGYPLYVAAAWVARGALGEANSAFVALSVAASVAAAVLTLGLAWRLLGGRGAAVASSLFLTSPNVWGHGLVAYPYAFLALVAAATAWMALETRWGRRDLSLPGAIVLGVGAGFRPDVVPLLGPVWLFGAAARGRRAVALGGAGLALGVLAWLVPMVERSGGWQAYLETTVVYGAYWTVPTESLPAFVAGVRRNLATLLAYLVQTTGPLLALLLVYGLGRVLAPPMLRARPLLALLPLWVVPPLAFYSAVHVGNLGYLLAVAPAFAILGAAAAEALASDLAGPAWGRRRAGALLAGIAGLAGLSSAALFLFLSGPVSLREVRDVDAELSRGLAIIRSYPRASSLVVAFDRYRQYEVYLPRRAQQGRVLSALSLLGANPTLPRVTVTPPAGVNTILLPDLYDNTSDRRASMERIRVTRDVTMFVAHLRPGERLRLGHMYARVLPAGS